MTEQDWREIMKFDLGRLQDFDPKALLCGDDGVDRFVLSLALAYNDLKSVHWMNFMLGKHQPPDTRAISADAGQWHGMRVGASRWMMAICHEILHAIAGAHEAGILKRASIRATLQEMGTEHLRRWKALVRVAASPGAAKGPLRGYLRDVRNLGAFHFAYSERLLEAYKANFVGDPKTPHNERAYVSFGPSLKMTRFFFADAAAQRMYVGTADLNKQFAESEELVMELHYTLQGFLFVYLATRLPPGAIRKS